ncbi:MAG: putative DNA binding domain-containing protein [Oscillospiraceae bacterium]|nr:putative DNA binding domain-containing protein [Oscillospiraceae bacterium]
MNYENENTEFKVQFTEDIYKEVVAFANTGGGDIFVGVDDRGTDVGLADIDDVQNRITNGIRGAILPDVTMFVRLSVQDGVIKITVSEGTNKPYYLRSKGLKPNGVYVRQGASSAPASIELIRLMIKQNDGDSFEDARSLDQNLTFESTAKAFERYGVKFSPEKYPALGITQLSSGLYSNLGFLLSDQCRHTIKIAVFSDEAKTIFKDSKEFGGSLFEQLDSAFDYLSLCNRTAASFKGLERIEHSDYPEAALREALLNAIVHRDYSFSGSIIINVTDNEIEFISIGGLLPGLSPDDIKSGISQPRNKRLVEVFHRIRLIESYGTGIRRIYNCYKDSPDQPIIEVTSNTFKITLFNTNSVVNGDLTAPRISAQMRKILNYVGKNGSITEVEIGELLGVKKTRSYTIASDMCKRGLLEQVEKGKDKKYVKNESQVQ